MDEELITKTNLQAKLPLPLAQLYRRAHNAQTARTSALFCFAMAALFLLLEGQTTLWDRSKKQSQF